MSELEQLDMFHEDALLTELSNIKESHHAVRKRLFAELKDLNNQQKEMMKLIIRQQDELDYLRVKMGLSCFVVR